jgi:hypothetical protein
MTGTSEQPADTGHRGPVTYTTYSYFSAHVDPDESIVHSGPKRGEGYHYLAPDGAHYQRNWSYHEDGSPTGIVGRGVTGAVVDGKVITSLTMVNHANRTYSEQVTEHPVTDVANAPALGLESSPLEVRQALRTGRATRQGTATVDGTPTIALSIMVPNAVHLTLYVDARTHQPLRSVTVVDGNPAPYVADRVPDTPENIAKARDDLSIPVGYTKVDFAGQGAPSGT